MVAITATVLDRVHLPSAPQSQHGPGQIQRPPTLRARVSDDEVIRAGYDLARRAIGYSLEGLPLREAIRSLLRETPSGDVLRIALDYLAYTRFEDVPRTEQVKALALMEDTRDAYDRAHEPGLRQAVGAAWHRLRKRLEEAMCSVGEMMERNAGDPYGGPLLPI